VTPTYFKGMQILDQLTDTRLTATEVLPGPAQLCESVPIDPEVADFVAQARQAIEAIILGHDPRLLVVVGPCSIHDVEAGKEYGQRLAALAQELSDRLFIVMRTYFEKPRTTIGWKGLIMDPHLDQTYAIPEGFKMARSFLREILQLGLPTATELLDPITPQYIADLVCWSAIGARTAESQTHRQLASGLSMPLGFKNSTDGSIQTAIHAIQAANHSQTFLGISKEGQASAISTCGNASCHLVLRGGRHGPNYDEASLLKTTALLLENQLLPTMMVDCNHANSNKDPNNQPVVLESVLKTRQSGQAHVMGVMLESNLKSGSQPFPQAKEDLEYGVSITDPCLGWEDTERVLRQAYSYLK
tara:strand:- start:44582 stop:45658 length:1077 start_codon:yes stop_codon:yes gene_type:complete